MLSRQNKVTFLERSKKSYTIPSENSQETKTTPKPESTNNSFIDNAHFSEQFKETVSKSVQTNFSASFATHQRFINSTVDSMLLIKLAKLQELQENQARFVNNLLAQYDLTICLQETSPTHTIEEKLNRIATILEQQTSQIVQLQHNLNSMEVRNKYLSGLLNDIADLLPKPNAMMSSPPIQTQKMGQIILEEGHPESSISGDYEALDYATKYPILHRSLISHSKPKSDDIKDQSKENYSAIF